MRRMASILVASSAAAGLAAGILSAGAAAGQERTVLAIGAHAGDAELTAGAVLARHKRLGDRVVPPPHARRGGQPEDDARRVR